MALILVFCDIFQIVGVFYVCFACFIFGTEYLDTWRRLFSYFLRIVLLSLLFLWNLSIFFLYRKRLVYKVSFVYYIFMPTLTRCLLKEWGRDTNNYVCAITIIWKIRWVSLIDVTKGWIIHHIMDKNIIYYYKKYKLLWKYYFVLSYNKKILFSLKKNINYTEKKHQYPYIRMFT